MAGTPSWLTKPALLRTLFVQLRLALRLIREPGVPLLTRVIPLLAVLYLVFPLDFVPDILPVLGQLDDLGIIALALELFLRLCPPRAKAFHEGALARGQRFSPMPGSADVIDVKP
jgi:uncharacterized membrane protein YkvA (DUF1232 family)